MNKDLVFASLEHIGKELFDSHRIVSSLNPETYGMAYGIIGMIGKDEICYSFNETQLFNWKYDFKIVRENIEEGILSGN